MSLKTIIAEKTTGRRGRPRKYPIPDTQQQDTSPIIEEKPREERSYKDFFPDLDIKEPLPLVKQTSIFDSSSDLSSTEDLNTKNSPLLDEYETPSERTTPAATAATKKLPIVSFEKLDKKDLQDRFYDSTSYQDLHPFHRPENHYIRYIEPSEDELFDTVEYDMDEQDEVWLQIYNKERRKENSGQLSSELFEAIIDQLEKEWFNLVKNLPKKTNNEPLLPEDSRCAVCDDGECENSNAIVFCDGCNLAVHQDCYGIPYIPEGQWLCRKCMVSPENPVSCVFCPFEGGAFKQTITNQWGHLLCAIWIPEVGLSNSVYMEPIDNMETIPKSRWKLTCFICRRRQGACIQCDNKHCFTAFHVTCARWARLCMRMKLNGSHYDDVALKAYCDRHTPKDYRDQVDVDKMVMLAQQWFSRPKHKTLMPRKRYVDEEDDDTYSDLEMDMKADGRTKKQRRQQAVTQLLPATKAARAHQHQYTAGAPIAPEYILDKLENLPCVKQATKLKKKSSLVTSICRYWSLKRESRRGAPLLKRLHLEPWTASASELKQTEVEKALKASSMMNLRADLEKVRMLSEQVQKRERQKLERIRKQKAYLEMILYPAEVIIQPILEHLIELDKKELFRYPVTLELAPDYLDIIKQPMSFADVIGKLSNHRYMNLDEFENDLSLIWKNSMTYNKAETGYYKQAQRLQEAMNELMSDAHESFKSFPIKSNGLLDTEISPEIFSYAEPLKPSPVPDTFAKDNKRRLDDKADTPSKKRRVTPRAQSEEVTIKKNARVTRSATEKSKRALRSRTITTQPPVKPKKTDTNKTPPRRTRRTTSPANVKEESEESPPKLKLIDDEIVWARVPKFPPHPAKIYDPKVSKKKIPENVLSLKPKENDDDVLVKFYLVGDAHTWGWVHKSDIHPFGNSAIDIEMLVQARKTRKAYRIREVKNAYRHICDLLHTDPELALNQVFNGKKK